MQTCIRTISAPLLTRLSRKMAMMVLAVSFSANGSVALDVMEGTRSDRFTLEREGDRFIRLDQQTGEISNCTFKQAELVCRLAIDERKALAEELDRLSSRIDELEKQMAQGNETTDENALTAKPELPNVPKTDEQLDSEFERVMDYTTKAMRRFFTMMKELRKDLESESN